MSTITVFHEHPSYRRMKPETIRLTRNVLKGENCAAVDVTVVFCGDRRIKELNKTWLQHNRVTDVISFTLSDPAEPVSGEIYINVDQAVRQAPEFNATVIDELRRLVVHGVLHLAGHDDGTDELRAAMAARENTYLLS